MKRRRRKMRTTREADCGREGEFFLLTARRLEFPQRETFHLSYRMMRVHIGASRGKTLRLFLLRALRDVNKDSEKKDLSLDLLKSVTVLRVQGSGKP